MGEINGKGLREPREGESAEVAPVATGHLALFPRASAEAVFRASFSLPPPIFPPSFPPSSLPSSLTSFFAFLKKLWSAHLVLVIMFGAGNEYIGEDNRDGPYSERTHSLR